MVESSHDLEQQPSVATLRETEEEEAREEHDPAGYGEKEEDSDVTSEDYRNNHRRHSYDYARDSSPDASRGAPLSRHNSAYTTISRLRSRNRADPVNADQSFYHPLSHTKTGADVLVDFDGKDDPYRPINWPLKKKAMTTLLYGLTTAGITFASSVYSAGVGQISTEFHVGAEVATLGISLILLGFGIGPLLWAPLSELYGRKAAVLLPYFIAAIFSFGSATAKDIQTLCITRFFTGFFGSAPITNTGGVLGDLWSPQQRGLAMVAYALAVTGGPTIGPLIGGAICENNTWRWTEYTTGILMMTILAFDVLLLDESFSPILLTYKARRLRHETGNWALHSSHEEWDVSLREIARKYLVRPFQLLFTPICFLVALYASFVYAILYSFFSAFPVAFQEGRGWNQVVGALPFLAVLLGILIGAAANVFFIFKYYYPRFEANHNRAVPEARLPPMMGGSICFAAGLFIFAWTSSPKIHWIGEQVGCVFIGIGFFTIFQACLNYLVDTFQKYGASAIAANTFLRSCLAAAFPLFISQELHALGVDWGVTVFACFSVLLIPVPFIFFVFGKRIRARGKWSKASVTD